ncbi:ribonuclease HI family protein [Desulfothermobacter acidiphilus]|uniref:ribonuclease HI family protein n=1 Tax=Desulfothermobacter acidiphilus TaxID=1938353 RepID=UPI003F8AC4D8
MRYLIYTDGASRGNPGPAAAAVVIFDAEGSLREFHAKLLGTATNNMAEWEALAWALELLAAGYSHQALELDIRSDSLLVVKQYHGEYQIRSNELRALAERVRNVLRAHPQWKLRLCHIPREQNLLADKLANQALDMGRR